MNLVGRSHLAERLLRDGWAVRVLDDLSTGNPENLAAVRGRLELVEGDVRDPETCLRACEGVDSVCGTATGWAA